MADNNKQISLEELAQDYGYAANFFFSDPELKSLIQQATSQQWSVQMFQAKLIASNWYRTHAASLRQFDEQLARDPATAQRMVEQQEMKIGQLAAQLGIDIPNARIDQMAKDTLRWGLNDQELRSAIVSEFNYQPGQTKGVAATNEDQIRKAANDFGLTISDQTVADWDRRMLTGDYTLDNINALLRNQAMTKYPGLNQYLSQGFNVRDVADPYIQSYSQILETPSARINLTDPLIQKALQGTQQAPGATKSGGGSTGTGSASSAPPVGPQSLYDFENSLRQDPRWLTTKNARDSMTQAGMGILRDWGLYK